MQKAWHYFNLARLALFQSAFGIIYAILTDTLNRVMTIELGIAAFVVGLMLNIREIMPLMGVKVWAGNLSDKTRIAGYRRTPFVLGGLIISAIAFMFVAPLAIATKTNYTLSLIQLFLLFTVFGVGYHASLTTYYALIADVAGEKNLSKVAAASWVLMVITGIITAVILGKALQPFTEEKLVSAMQTASLIALGIGLLTVIGVESRSTDSAAADSIQKTDNTISFFQSLQLINVSPMTKAFAFYIFISIFAAFGTELVMELYGADVFGLSVSETTKFRQYLGGAQLLFMLLTGFFMNRVGLKRAITFGNFVASLGYVMLIASGVIHNFTALYVSLVVIGIGLGCCTVGNIVFMISMNAGRTGLYVGLWGTAQSLAMFVGGPGVGSIRDALMFASPNPIIAYGTIFILIIISFTISTVMLPQFSTEKFTEESKVSLEKVFAVAAD
jgi:MFS transporter, BCD family, chlorophyll transporter